MLHFSLQVDIFEIDAVDLLEITKVLAGHDATDAGSGWYLDKVIVRVTVDGETKCCEFPCNR